MALCGWSIIFLIQVRKFTMLLVSKKTWEHKTTGSGEPKNTSLMEDSVLTPEAMYHYKLPDLDLKNY